MEILNMFLEYWSQLVLILVAIFPAWKGMKYLMFSKEVLDIYVSYRAGSAPDSPGGETFTDAEKIAFANEIIQAIESGKTTFNNVQKKIA